MTPEEAKRLLGGYATGSLTAEEMKALFSAALEDQALFEALAEEEALRELLADESYRADLVAALGEERSSLGVRLAAWWQRPQALAWAGGMAAVVLAAVMVYQIGRPPAVTEIAMVAKEEIAEAPAARPQPAAKPLEPLHGGAELPVPAPEEEVATAVSMSKSAEALEESPSEPAVAVVARPAEGAAVIGSVGDVTREGLAPEPKALAFLAGASEAPPEQIVRGQSIRSLAAPTPSTAAARPMAQAIAAHEADTRQPYAVERATSDGSWQAVPPNSPIGLSEQVRLTIVAPQSGILVVRDETAGAPLWSSSVEQGQTFDVPLPAPDGPGVRRLALRYPEGGAASGVGGGVAAFRVGGDASAMDTVITLQYEER